MGELRRRRRRNEMMIMKILLSNYLFFWFKNKKKYVSEIYSYLIKYLSSKCKLFLDDKINYSVFHMICQNFYPIIFSKRRQSINV
jgi:hypothetical protein